MTALARRGLMLVLSSPSGAGKTTLASRLLAADPDFAMSVSATTRPMRSGEIHGKDYFFVSHDEFERMAGNEEFLEHAHVFSHRYGTPRKPVIAALEAGKDVLFDIDWQGTQQLAQQVKDDLVRVFILPPSMAELQRRLHTRAQDPAEIVAARMAKAKDEISHWAEYDYVVPNDDIALVQQQLETIIAAERLKRQRQTGLTQFVQRLLNERQIT